MSDRNLDFRALYMKATYDCAQLKVQCDDLTEEISCLRDENEMLKSNLPASSAIRGLAEQHKEITRLRAENEKLRELIRNVSRGIQSYRPDINMAGVWLKPLQEIDAYLRELDEAAALKETGDE